MDDPKKGRKETIIQECIERLQTGKLLPWKIEEELISGFGIIPPDNYGIAALCRQRYIEGETGEEFKFITIPKMPYKVRYLCEEDDFAWELDAMDSDHKCGLCSSQLKPLNQYAALVANYVGGSENYYSFAGRIKVKGDLEKEFTNLLVYGTGLGPIGVTRGSFVINKCGGAEVKVAEFGSAARCLAFLFKTEKIRNKAAVIIEAYQSELKTWMNKTMSEFGGRISSVEFVRAESKRGYILYVDFAADFDNFRGHGDISRAVGQIKKKIEARFQRDGVKYDLCVIAQGYDGDLKPSHRNKRGRYASAQIRVPLNEFEELFQLNSEKFLSFVEIDSIGAEKLGCQFYSGMGGEIIPAMFKATKVNPQSSLVSSFQKIYAGVEDGDVIYGVELPNVEVGIASTREGLIPPAGRESMKIMGIRTAREFAASMASQVLAGEFNLALEIARGRLYA